jgi:hypothetical protein
MVSRCDIDDIPRLLQSNAAALFGVEPIHGKAAKVAFGIADVGDGELKITRPAVIEHFANKLKQPFFGTSHRT